MSMAWILPCQFVISLVDLEILLKQPVKELCSDLHRPTVALFHTPIWGMGTLAAPLSFSNPRDGGERSWAFPWSPHTVHFDPWCFIPPYPVPQFAACSWATCFLCWLLSADWRLLGSNGKNEERAVWLPRGDLRHLCTLTRQNHRLRCHYPDGHTLWHGWALWWHQGIH